MNLEDNKDSIFNRKKPSFKKNAFRRKKAKKQISLKNSDPKTFILKNKKMVDMVKSMHLKTLPGSSMYFNKHAMSIRNDLKGTKRLKSPKSEIEKSVFSVTKNSFLSPRSEKSRLGESSRFTNSSKMLSPRVINTERSAPVNL